MLILGVVAYVLSVFMPNAVSSSCSKIDSCSCRWTNGSVTSLKSLVPGDNSIAYVGSMSLCYLI